MSRGARKSKAPVAREVAERFGSIASTATMIV